MKYLKNFLKDSLISLLCLFSLLFLITIFSYLNLFNSKVVSIFEIIIPIFALALAGYLMGKKASKKGFLEGIKIGLFIILLFLISCLIISGKITFKNTVYWFILLISSTLGSMVGINKKESSN